MLLFPKTRASRAQPKAPPREAHAMAICPQQARDCGSGGGWREWWVGARKAQVEFQRTVFGVHRWDESPKVRAWERVCFCVCLYVQYLCVWVCGLGRQENCRALFFCFLSLSYLHSQGVQSFACAVLLRRLNTSPPPSVSLSPPTLPPSLFRFNTSFTRAVCALGDGLPSLSHPALLSSLFSVSLSLCLFP